MFRFGVDCVELVWDDLVWLFVWGVFGRIESVYWDGEDLVEIVCRDWGVEGV